jgi:MFS family permease
MWQLGFFFHEMAFGLLSIFLPLYIVNIGGSLVDVGLMASLATLLAIPASFIWGYLCDKTRRYKRYILISFLTSSTLLYSLTFTKDMAVIIALYAAMAVFHVAHEPPKNVLICELYPREEWERSFALYEGLTEAGWLTGLVTGVFISLLGFKPTTTLLICSSLNLLAFLSSLLLLSDPPLIFERSLVRIRRGVDLAYRGITILSKLLNGFPTPVNLVKENLALFCAALVFFAFATSTLFTPLPIFLHKNLGLTTTLVYTVYVLNSAAGMIGYFLTGGKLTLQQEKKRLQKVVLLRSGLAFLLAAFTISAQTAFPFALILFLMGFAYALYYVCVLSLSMELIPAGMAGLFDALVGLGSAAGAYLGPYVAQTFGFSYVFATSGAAFLLAYIFFKASL